ncbi:MAG: sugar ABC transporter substrate-binding protein, partial [Geminicoccaceae bacterium]
MLKHGFVAALAGALLGATALAHAEELTIATVNNADMIIMQKLAPKWEQATGNKI